ncbi:oligopeptide:H+ symporter [Vibrio sp. S4M6]|uniref:peptide MFS transporter n=1 Tax=Vibrio sinus TaxID=2946865 RepID=UPI00202AC175|nr:oligopeptide:H+ symporter [Vibrio sinus]MCL9781339.1 oligopeptide:H+ symporter [Vibrio sinus]
MSLASTANRLPLQDRIPRGAAALFFIQIFSTLAFAVLYSTLVLYTTKKLGFTPKEATAIMGVFGAFNYGLHLFGGCLGGRFLSNRNLFVFGMILQGIGCALIASGTVANLYWGLGMFLTGSGLNVTCINMMLTQRFTPEDPRRETAFIWNYAGMNLGFFIGFAVAGYYQLSENYHALFMFAAIGNVIATVLALLRWKVIADTDTPLLQQSSAGFRIRFGISILILIGLVPVIRSLLQHANFSNSFVISLGILVLLFLIFLTVRHKPLDEKKRMAAYLILALGSLLFWSLYQLAPMGLELFAEYNINRHVMGITIAPQWIQNINTIVIVIGGPLMTILFNKLRERGWCIDIPLQFSLSLLLIGAGFLLLPMGISLAGPTGMVAFSWIAWSYVLQSFGELLISPIGYAMIGRLAPSRYQGLMMGSWMMVTGVASVLSSYFSGLMPQHTAGQTVLETNPGYSTVFGHLGWSAVALAVVLAILIPLLRRLINNSQVPSVK